MNTKCTVCQQEFDTEAKLQEHMTAVHPESAEVQAEDGMDEARQQTDDMVDEGAEELEETPAV